MKNTHKISLVIVSVIVLSFTVVAVCYGGFAFYLTSAKSYCGDYAQQKSKTADSPDRAVAELYDQCLRDKGLPGF